MSMEDALRAAREARAKRQADKLAADGKTEAQRLAEEKAKAAAYHKKDVDEERKQFVELKAIHDRVRAADLDSWYEALKDFTYRTEFVPITADEGLAIIRWRDHHRNGAPLKPFAIAKDLAAIEAMKQRLQKALDGFPDGAFVKLSSRSPKDAVVTCAKTIALFRQYIAEEQAKVKAVAAAAAAPAGAGAAAAAAVAAGADAADSKAAAPTAAVAPTSPSVAAVAAAAAAAAASASPSAPGSDGVPLCAVAGAAAAFVPAAAEVSDNAKLIAINRAHIMALRSVSAQDVLDTFLSSERVYEDLTLAREHVKHTPWGQKFVLRAWTAVPIEYEFRGFVYGNTLTALSQYYHYCHFPELVQRKEHVLALIRAFFEQLKEKVPLTPKEYVVDFAVDVSAGRVYVIELNPFGAYEGMGTSCAMFDKRKDADAQVLFGLKPFEFRIETEPHPGVFQKMTDAWKELFIAEGHLPPPGHAAAAAPATPATSTAPPAPAASPSHK